MFVINKLVSKLPQCTYFFKPNMNRLTTEVARNIIYPNQNQKKPEKRRMHALQNEIFGLPIGDYELQPCPPELIGFTGFMFKNKDLAIRLEKDIIKYRQKEMIKPS